jgi:predicted RNA binding protein YcfA (HicA-like mRNA interferase family)
MVKKRKLLEKAPLSPGNLRFEEFVTLLEAFGFKLDRVRGSHHVFNHSSVPELLSVQPKSGGKASPIRCGNS